MIPIRSGSDRYQAVRDFARNATADELVTLAMKSSPELFSEEAKMPTIKKTKQTRRSVSVNGKVFWKFRSCCNKSNVSMSGVVTNLIKSWCKNTELTFKKKNIKQAKNATKSEKTEQKPVVKKIIKQKKTVESKTRTALEAGAGKLPKDNFPNEPEPELFEVEESASRPSWGYGKYPPKPKWPVREIKSPKVLTPPTTSESTHRPSSGDRVETAKSSDPARPGRTGFVDF